MKIEKYFNGKEEKNLIIIISIVNIDRWKKNKNIILDSLSKQVSYWVVFNEDNNGSYNCGEAFNKATEICKTDIIIYSTGDILIEPQLLWRAYELLLIHNLPVFTYRMDEQEDGSWKENDDALGDFIMVKREWALAVSGWDPRLLNWGIQDYDFLGRLGLLLQGDYSKLGIVLGYKVEDRVKHFYHPRRDDEWYREQNKKNWLIIKEQGLWTKEMYEELKKDGEIECYEKIAYSG